MLPISRRIATRICAGCRSLSSSTSSACTITQPPNTTEISAADGYRKYNKLITVRLGSFMEGFVDLHVENNPKLYLIRDFHEHHTWVSREMTPEQANVVLKRSDELHVKFFRPNDNTHLLELHLQQKQDEEKKVHVVKLEKEVGMAEVFDIRVKAIDIYNTNDVMRRLCMINSAIDGFVKGLVDGQRQHLPEVYFQDQQTFNKA